MAGDGRSAAWCGRRTRPTRDSARWRRGLPHRSRGPARPPCARARPPRTAAPTAPGWARRTRTTGRCWPAPATAPTAVAPTRWARAAPGRPAGWGCSPAARALGTVGADDVGVPVEGPLRRAHLGVEVDVHEAEPLGEPVGPLEVVHQRPAVVAPDVDALPHGGGDGAQVGVEVVDPRDAGVAALELDEQVGHGVGDDGPAEVGRRVPGDVAVLERQRRVLGGGPNPDRVV